MVPGRRGAVQRISQSFLVSPNNHHESHFFEVPWLEISYLLRACFDFRYVLLMLTVQDTLKRFDRCGPRRALHLFEDTPRPRRLQSSAAPSSLFPFHWRLSEGVPLC